MILIGPVFPTTEKLADMGLRVALTILVALGAQRLLFVLVRRVERFLVRAGRDTEQAKQRSRTLGQIFRHLVTVVVAATGVIHILSILGWDVRPLLAGVGILGVAVGFGAQTLVRDVIAGVFILAENQFGVGDLIEINGKGATVEAISLRTTMLRDFHGYVHYVPNGELKTVTNRSRGWNRLAVDVTIAADQDLDAALDVCRRVAAELNGDPRWRERLLDPVEVWGLESVGSQEAHIRTVIRARPGPDGPEASRELRRRVHGALAEAGIRRAVSREVSLSSPAAQPPAPDGG